MWIAVFITFELIPGRWSTWPPLEGGFQKILLSWIYPDPNDLYPQSPGEVKQDIFKTLCMCVCDGVCVCVRGPTLANRLSCGVLTPKRGMQAGAKLGLCVAFFTPLICDIGLFFFSLSFGGGDRISTSCCFSATYTKRHRDILLNKYLCLQVISNIKTFPWYFIWSLLCYTVSVMVCVTTWHLSSPKQWHSKEE